MAHYFDLIEADPHDQELKLAKAKGVVPQGCRLHGALVLGIHETGGDPCGECNAERDVCGGRPLQNKQLERGERGLPATDDAGVRRLTRMRQVNKVLGLFRGAEHGATE